MKKITNVLCLMIVLLSFPFMNACNKEKEEDKYNRINEYLTLLVDKIENMEITDTTYTKEIVSFNKDGSEGDKKIVKSTYNEKLDAYLKRELKNDNSYEALSYKNVGIVYLWEDNLEESGLIVDSNYLKSLVREDYREDLSIYSEYKGLSYKEVQEKNDTTKNTFKSKYEAEGKEILKLDISTYFKENKNKEYEFVNDIFITISEEDDGVSEVSEVSINYSIKFTSDNILSISLIYKDNEEEKNSLGEVIETSCTGYKSSVSISNNYEKEFYTSVERFNSYPSETKKSKVKIYVNGELNYEDEKEMGTYIETKWKSQPYTDETYLDTTSDYVKSYEDNICYFLDKSSTNYARARVVVVYLNEKNGKLEHKKTTYEVVEEGRYVLDLEIDGVKYNDKIVVNGEKINYESFGVLKGEFFLVHCYAISK